MTSSQVVANENARLTMENRRLRRHLDNALDVLEHYAEPKNYTKEGIVTTGGAFGRAWGWEDRGGAARAAINEIKRDG